MGPLPLCKAVGGVSQCKTVIGLEGRQNPRELDSICVCQVARLVCDDLPSLRCFLWPCLPGIWTSQGTLLPGKWAIPPKSDHSSVLQRLESTLLSASFFILLPVVSISCLSPVFWCRPFHFKIPLQEQKKRLVGCIYAVEEDIVGGGGGFREGMRPCGDWEEDEHRCASEGNIHVGGVSRIQRSQTCSEFPWKAA